MSAAFWPWNVMGIAPTDDRKTIREAYSRLLKALNHEAETEAYMDLRHARDAALSGQFLHPPEHHEGEEDDFGLGSPFADDQTPPEETTVPAADPDVKPVFNVEYSDDDDQRFKRMVELFLGEGELALAESEELNQHLNALFADERMGDLGHYARVESWLAQLLADHHPRGAELFVRVSDYFHWPERAHELGIHPAIPWLFNAHEGVSLVRALETASHEYHREWIELARGKPDGMLWTRAIDKPRMANLIETIRRDYPWLEREHWQPQLVERWEKASAGGSVKGPGAWTWIGLVFIVLAMIGEMPRNDPSQTDVDSAGVAVLEMIWADERITEFIANFPEAAGDGRSAETLRARSPKIYATLQRSGNVPETLTEQGNRAMMESIMEAYYLIIDKLPYDKQAADARFRAAEVKRLKDDPEGCADFIRKPSIYLRQRSNIDALSPEYRYQMFSVVHDEYDDREWGLVQKEASISGELIGKLITRSGVPEARLREILRSRTGQESDVCRVMGSFYELLSEIPAKEASRLLPAVL